MLVLIKILIQRKLVKNRFLLISKIIVGIFKKENSYGYLKEYGRGVSSKMIFLKGIIIGMLVCLPVGPLGLLAIQRTISKGRKIGFLSGVGAATSDLIYSFIAILGISFVGEFLNKNRYLIDELTGILFLIVGINILVSGIEKGKVKEATKEELMHPFFIHFLLGLSNPMTFIIFFTIFTKMGIDVNGGGVLKHIVFIISIFTGACITWFITTNIIERTKRKFKYESFIFMDKLIGSTIVLCGVFSVVKGIMKF